jgi:aspartyl-tRNA(Asn)/glutamyl-tRNA(Gln) amidotransferase subunit A
LSLAFGSLGTDTGGSIRIPAALCGIVGLKPTYGLVSLRGVLPLSWSLDHAGPMTKTVEDAALMLGLVAGHDPHDPYSRNVPVPSYTSGLEDGVRGVRIGIPKSYFFERVAPEVEAAVQQAIRTLEKLGARPVEVDLPSAKLQRAIFMQIVSPEAWSYHETHLRTHGDLYGADVRDRIETGRLLLSVDYVRAQRARGLMKAECRGMFRDADVVITPTVPIPPPRIDEKTVTWGSETETIYSALTRFTRPFNIVGLPAVSIPCGFTSNTLPIGLQIAGKPFDESTILRVARAYERDSEWSERRPNM